MKKKDIALHHHIAALNAAFSAAGFRATLSGDAASYRAAVAAIPDYHIYSPLDDSLADFGAGMLWVGLEDAQGRMVAVEAGRVIDAPAKAGGLNAVLNSRVFGRVLPVVDRPPPVNLTGRLAYLGGAWVDPDLRGRRVMSLTLKLTIAHLVRCYGIDAVFGFVRSKHAGLALAPEGYGFTSATALDLMYLPGEAAADLLCLVWTDPGILAERWSLPADYQIGPAAARGKTGKKPSERRSAGPSPRHL
ncbi:hypothetical protein [Ferrovibrio xuzhouensis]|uniref:N-acetyltransferase domain-containing protein n=1 Tax=Ferrovibrio xuzhouensis TaxID=1576914 RepID=A0ABV7VCB2_9PROT